MKTQLISLEQLTDEAFTGSWGTARAWVERVGGTVETDWAGREAVAISTAEKATSAYRAEAEKGAQRLAALEQALADWQEQRTEAGRAAYEKAAHARLEAEAHELRDEYTWIGGVYTTLSPSGVRHARDKQVQAIQAFERRHPKPAPETFK